MQSGDTFDVTVPNIVLVNYLCYNVGEDFIVKTQSYLVIKETFCNIA